jgi:DNA-binding TFAR19-related protein
MSNYDSTDSYDEELEELKRRKLEELRREAEEKRKLQEEQHVKEAELMALLRVILEPEALGQDN